jgi:hypothetical protein
VLRALAALSLAAALAGGPAPPARAQPAPAPPTTIDGASPDIVGVTGLAVARDGTGGLGYVKAVGGVQHVFVSRLVGGAFLPGEQVDSAFAGASSQPVIAAANDGLLVIAFINSGNLYAVSRPPGATGFESPDPLFAGAANPSLQMTTLGKAYVAFTAAGAGGHDVRAAYYFNDHWALEPTPLDANPADDSGTGTGRPSVAAAGDGVGIVAWGEAGHIYVRRVWAATPSVVYEQADVPSLSGYSEASADEPVVGSGGDSSYADVVFRETLTDGTNQQTRVLMRRLRGGQFDPVVQPDGVTTPSPSQAGQPQVAMNEYGRGFITSAHTDTNALFAAHLGTNGASGPLAQVDSLTNASPPFGVPATAGLTSTLIAWQEGPGAGGTPQIRVRYAPDGATLGPEQVLSNPAQGTPDAADGLVAGGDAGGDAAVAWTQASGLGRQIVVAQMYQPPGGFAPAPTARYVRSAQPTLAWNPAREQWGPIHYVVAVGGVVVGQTYSTALRVPGPLPDGPHRWSVVAFNPAGLSSTMRPATVWIDATPPQATVALSGPPRVGRTLRASVATADLPPVSEPGARESGVREVTIKWGDGTSARLRRGRVRLSHAYVRTGRFTITVRVSDRAGNTATTKKTVRITSGKPATKPPGKRSSGKGKRP